MAKAALKPTSLEKTVRAAKEFVVRRKPYFVKVVPGVALGYRRNQGPGVWVVRGADGKGSTWIQTFATADDVAPANGEAIMTYKQALKRAQTVAQSKGVVSTADHKRPITVEGAIDAYQSDLIARGQSEQNATSTRFHLKGSPIFRTSVMLLEKAQLAAVRNGMVASGMKPASADRVGKSLKAALNLAASHDPRITNAKAWSQGWSLLPNSSTANNVILTDEVVGAIVRKAYSVDQQLGLQLDILAETGTRESQMLRLRVGDLQDGRPDPRLMMPSSFKGKNRKPVHKAVPITPRLAGKLRAAVAGRPATAPIVREILRLSDRFREIANMVGGVDPAATPYALRHSSIVRGLTRNVAIRVLASTHDTSVWAIETHYSAFITDHTDAMSRAALPDFGEVA
jgi:integrase